MTLFKYVTHISAQLFLSLQIMAKHFRDYKLKKLFAVAINFVLTTAQLLYVAKAMKMDEMRVVCRLEHK